MNNKTKYKPIDFLPLVGIFTYLFKTGMRLNATPKLRPEFSPKQNKEKYSALEDIISKNKSNVNHDDNNIEYNVNYNDIKQSALNKIISENEKQEKKAIYKQTALLAINATYIYAFVHFDVIKNSVLYLTDKIF